MKKFKVQSKYNPSGDQENAVSTISGNVLNGSPKQTLLGVTGSGKTFTMAKIIEKVQRPTLIISHNKTLAAQLYREFCNYFPENAVEYFVSYYDYYQPEAYVAARDLYIEKDASINDEIDKMRLRATASLIERNDVIIVATVSCIYGLGTPDLFKAFSIIAEKGRPLDRDQFIKRLIDNQYTRDDMLLKRGHFRVRGEIIDVYPSYADQAVRIEFFYNEIENIQSLDVINNKVIDNLDSAIIFPAKHFLTSHDIINTVIPQIREDLDKNVGKLIQEGKDLEAKRLKQRTEFDLEMITETGSCSGIENYSRYFAGREPGARPNTLIDYFENNFIVFIDESHVTIPQIGGMYAGDRSRKLSLVEHGFRLPAALDNRPLFFGEFESLVKQAVYVSATPGDYEREQSQAIVEQIIRPTGLIDPKIYVKPTAGQIDDLINEIHKVTAKEQRIMVTTLTKKSSEDLTDYLLEKGIKVTYLHSEIDTLKRIEILHDFRSGVFDVLVGINLLREGLDMPEVSLVAILDADKIGFLRSTTSLVQTIGRAARNVNGYVIMYADKMSKAMEDAINETNRRRKIQIEYNKKHGITPKTIKKQLDLMVMSESKQSIKAQKKELLEIKNDYNLFNPDDRKKYLRVLSKEMLEYAKNLEFEKAAILRDEIDQLKKEWQ